MRCQGARRCDGVRRGVGVAASGRGAHALQASDDTCETRTRRASQRRAHREPRSGRGFHGGDAACGADATRGVQTDVLGGDALKQSI